MGGCQDYCSSLSKEARTLHFWRDVGAEFLASFLLMSAQSALPTQWGQPLGPSALQVSMGMGFIVTVLAWSLGDFGGAHMNPAVSVAMMGCRKISILRGMIYIIVQCIGCILGAGFISLVTPAESRNNLAVTLLGSGVTPLQGVIVEMWITCVLVLTILGSTNSDRKPDLYMPPLPIGCAVAVCIMAANGHTGASMNPARSIGPAVITGIWTDHWVYWIGPILGGGLATIIYVLMFDRVKDSRPISPVGSSKNLVCVYQMGTQQVDQGETGSYKTIKIEREAKDI